jgi:hypothetical protein
MSGVVPSITHGWVRLWRLIDRGNNRYQERVENLDGTVIHEADEQLTEHQGHGSAKFKQNSK